MDGYHTQSKEREENIGHFFCVILEGSFTHCLTITHTKAHGGDKIMSLSYKHKKKKVCENSQISHPFIYKKVSNSITINM